MPGTIALLDPPSARHCGTVNFSGVGAEGAERGSAPSKVLICQKFGQKSFDTFNNTNEIILLCY